MYSQLQPLLRACLLVVTVCIEGEKRQVIAKTRKIVHVFKLSGQLCKVRGLVDALPPSLVVWRWQDHLEIALRSLVLYIFALQKMRRPC